MNILEFVIALEIHLLFCKIKVPFSVVGCNSEQNNIFFWKIQGKDGLLKEFSDHNLINLAIRRILELLLDITMFNYESKALQSLKFLRRPRKLLF